MGTHCRQRLPRSALERIYMTVEAHVRQLRQPKTVEAHIRQSRPDSGLGFHVKVLTMFQVVPLGGAAGGVHIATSVSPGALSSEYKRVEALNIYKTVEALRKYKTVEALSKYQTVKALNFMLTSLQCFQLFR